MKKIILAGCVILNDRGHLLLMHRNTPSRKQWETPGGKIEKGESAPDAAAREVHEELGIAVTIGKKLGEKTFVEDGYEMEYIWYAADIASGEPKIIETEKYDGLQYFSFDELRRMTDLSPNAKNLIVACEAGAIKV